MKVLGPTSGGNGGAVASRSRRRVRVWLVLGSVLALVPATVLIVPALFRGLTLQPASRLAVGQRHSCVVTATGDVRCWGSNDHGQLGDATTLTRSAPVLVTGLSEVTSVASGAGDHTCALTRGRTVLCWGRNDRGQLGNGTTASSSVPVPVTGLRDVTGIAVGRLHSCAVLADGGVRCWGANDLGELGDGSTTGSTTPVAVVGLPIAMTAVSAYAGSTCAVTERGRIRCWGDNSDGQLGTGTTDPALVASPATSVASRVTRIAAGDTHACAVALGGGVICWGAGSGGTTSVPVPGLGSGVALVASGYARSCAVRSGAVLCWDASRSSSPTELWSSGAVAVAVGAFHGCALLDSGGVRCWGANQDGQLGDGTTRDSATPVTVAGL